MQALGPSEATGRVGYNIMIGGLHGSRELANTMLTRYNIPGNFDFAGPESHKYHEQLLPVQIQAAACSAAKAGPSIGKLKVRA